MGARIATYLRQHHIALLALFVALGGTSYAAIKLPANSVGERQLKKSSVSHSKIKPGAIRARHFPGGSLPVGPAGEPGPEGPVGPQGPTGTVDTSQFYDKAASDARFAPAGEVIYGHALWRSTTQDTILEVPELLGLRISTTGNQDRRIFVQTQQPGKVCLFHGASGTQCIQLNGTGVNHPSAEVAEATPWTTFFALANDPSRTVEINCIFADAAVDPDYVRCFGLRSAPSG